jgi:hypothetical protein
MSTPKNTQRFEKTIARSRGGTYRYWNPRGGLPRVSRDREDPSTKTQFGDCGPFRAQTPEAQTSRRSGVEHVGLLLNADRPLTALSKWFGAFDTRGNLTAFELVRRRCQYWCQ